jgi:hypothetical protein
MICEVFYDVKAMYLIPYLGQVFDIIGGYGVKKQKYLGNNYGLKHGLSTFFAITVVGIIFNTMMTCANIVWIENSIVNIYHVDVDFRERLLYWELFSVMTIQRKSQIIKKQHYHESSLSSQQQQL